MTGAKTILVKKNAETTFILEPPHRKSTEVTAGSDERWLLSP